MHYQAAVLPRSSMVKTIAAYRRLAPGVALCVGVAALACGLERLERGLFGHGWLEALVLAIMIGTVIRTLRPPGRNYAPGIDFSARILLECAVLLLGGAVSLKAIAAAGPALPGAIAGLVVVAIGCGYAIGRGLGLPHRLSVLMACGNAICGNSAIAAVAPVIGADGEDVSAAIGFTAILGVLAVLGLPLLASLLSMSALRYGVLAGLTVYAVPQVLAATAPAGIMAVQVGTLVKLTRVMMLGPVVVVASLLTNRRSLAVHRLVPWFIVGFAALAAARSAGLIPHAALAPAAFVANLLTVVAMAALGLGTDLRLLARAGARVSAAVSLSLLALGGLSFGLIAVLHLH